MAITKGYLNGITLLTLLCGSVNAAVPHYYIERLGFTGPDYTGVGFYGGPFQYSYASQLNATGQVAGISNRFTGSQNLGTDVWFYNGSSTIQLGYTDPANYVTPSGWRESNVTALNDLGQVTGYSSRYSPVYSFPDQGRGRDVWLYTGTGTIQLGYIGAGYEKTNGSRQSAIIGLNNLGQVAGNSNRYSGMDFQGCDAWLYNGSSTVQLGFIGTGYEQFRGYRCSYATALNELGYVVGESQRYNFGGTIGGTDAWLYNGSSTIQLGLTGTGYQGYQSGKSVRYSVPAALNNQGQVVGNSGRYSPAGTSLGADAWLYTGSSTIPLGLTGSGYEQPDGYRISQAEHLNEQGHVAGTSWRYSGTTELGRDVWLYNGSTTKQLGFTGIGYEQVNSYQNGYRVSQIVSLNNRGQVAGGSFRYSGDTYLGDDAWLYDPDLNQTFKLSGAVPDSAYAVSQVNHLSDDGIAVGMYQLFDQGTGEDLGPRAFYFSVEDGFHDLGPLVDDLTQDGWETLASAVAVNGGGKNIIGHGTLPGSETQAVFLLSPPVIEVQMDVIPDNSANKVALNNPKRWIGVAILGARSASGDTFDFDATQVDATTVRFGSGEAQAISGPSFADYNRDSITDMLVYFLVQDSGIVCGDTEASLTGKTLSGQSFEATDWIQTTNCKL